MLYFHKHLSVLRSQEKTTSCLSCDLTHAVEHFILVVFACAETRCFVDGVEMQKVLKERIKDADLLRTRSIDLVFYGMAEVRFSRWSESNSRLS